MLFEDRSRAESFGSVAELYDRVRPSYPSELVDPLVSLGQTDRDAASTADRDQGLQVLDVRCGTGIAAALLAARGCAVLVLGGQTASDRDAAERSGAAVRDLRESGLFDDITTRKFPWRRTYTSAEWLDFLHTHSDHHVLPPDRRERLISAVGEAIDELGGSFEVEYGTELTSARRR